MSVNLYKNAPRVLMLATALGFGFVLLELVMLGHTQGGKLTGAISAALGLVLGVLGLANVGGLRKILPVLFLVLALSGLWGALAHSGARGFRSQGVSQIPASVTEDRTVGRAVRSFAALPPTLAPIMLTGLALLGAIAALMASGESIAMSERRSGAMA
jgi:hypothetical protein